MEGRTPLYRLSPRIPQDGRAEHAGFVLADPPGPETDLSTYCTLLGVIIRDERGDEREVRFPPACHLPAGYARSDARCVPASRLKLVWILMSDANWDGWDNVRIVTLDLRRMTVRLSERGFSNVLETSELWDENLQPADRLQLSEDGNQLVVELYRQAGGTGWALFEEVNGHWYAEEVELGTDIPHRWKFTPERTN